MDCPVRKVDESLAAGEAKLPSFDHAKGDPVPDDVQILPEHRVVLVEGNYVLMGTPSSSIHTKSPALCFL